MHKYLFIVEKNKVTKKKSTKILCANLNNFYALHCAFYKVVLFILTKDKLSKKIIKNSR